MNKVQQCLLALSILVVSACTDGRIYEDFHSLPNQSWGAHDSLIFDLQDVKLANSPNLVAVKFNEEYSFSNCYLRVISKDSAGMILENKLVNMILFDPKSGEPLGEGFGNSYTRYDTLPFLFDQNTKSVTLLQYMRQDQLPGVEAVGIKILN
ncbi:gliding motility-associated lipoprotein GldH [Algoriphagus ratkowskyi]|uniref:Gliding motility-associated lipoprotein GldH n=1 Tax=Algoriphagus ratkowskyi TaxID=57028 RepID=A0A2W7RN15_9BACT|nr:gliding motility lipoprotein GldH [Algoriphagus ratkowskyi]PZX60356.1 gliding motility-associated lipoprotein GldH [Algoriphagus ratkowskyi]TXD78173.1 gliding motility-associated lipoprotein GldH [Algoriphagus ratkowskyi]